MPSFRPSFGRAKSSKAKLPTAPASKQASPNLPTDAYNAEITEPLEISMVCQAPYCDLSQCGHSPRIHQAQSQRAEKSFKGYKRNQEQSNQQQQSPESYSRPTRLNLTGVTNYATYALGTAPWDLSHSPLPTPERLPEVIEYEPNVFEHAAMRPAPLQVRSPQTTVPHGFLTLSMSPPVIGSSQKASNDGHQRDSLEDTALADVYAADNSFETHSIDTTRVDNHPQAHRLSQDYDTPVLERTSSQWSRIRKHRKSKVSVSSCGSPNPKANSSYLSLNDASPDATVSDPSAPGTTTPTSIAPPTVSNTITLDPNAPQTVPPIPAIPASSFSRLKSKLSIPKLRKSSSSSPATAPPPIPPVTETKSPQKRKSSSNLRRMFSRRSHSDEDSDTSFDNTESHKLADRPHNVQPEIPEYMKNMEEPKKSSYYGSGRVKDGTGED